MRAPARDRRPPSRRAARGAAARSGGRRRPTGLRPTADRRSPPRAERRARASRPRDLRATDRPAPSASDRLRDGRGTPAKMCKFAARRTRRRRGCDARLPSVARKDADARRDEAPCRRRPYHRRWRPPGEVIGGGIAEIGLWAIPRERRASYARDDHACSTSATGRCTTSISENSSSSAIVRMSSQSLPCASLPMTVRAARAQHFGSNALREPDRDRR